jgi:hypothetical protein
MFALFLAAARAEDPATMVQVVLEPPTRPFQAVQLSCGDWRDRAELVDGVAAFSGVPDGPCRATLKGGGPVVLHVRAGERQVCTYGVGGAKCVTGPVVLAPPPPPPPPAAPLPPPPPPGPPVPNLRLGAGSAGFTQVEVTCGQFRARAALVDGAAYVPDLPATPCSARFSAPPPAQVALPGGPVTCVVGPGGDGRCEPGAELPSTTAPLTVVLAAGGAPYYAMEVECPSGFRDRADFVEGRATLPDVPRELCEVRFKGAAPVLPTHLSTLDGEERRCHIDGVVPRCT